MKKDRSCWSTDLSRAIRIRSLIQNNFYVPFDDLLFLDFFDSSLRDYCPLCCGELYRIVVSDVDKYGDFVSGIRFQCWSCDLDVTFFSRPGSRFSSLEFLFLDYCHSIENSKGV